MHPTSTAKRGVHRVASCGRWQCCNHNARVHPTSTVKRGVHRVLLKLLHAQRARASNQHREARRAQSLAQAPLVACSRCQCCTLAHAPLAACNRCQCCLLRCMHSAPLHARSSQLFQVRRTNTPQMLRPKGSSDKPQLATDDSTSMTEPSSLEAKGSSCAVSFVLPASMRAPSSRASQGSSLNSPNFPQVATKLSNIGT